MAGRLRRAPFIGRADELAQLDAALVDAVGAKAGTVLIGGDAGVGKTRLVQEFTRQAQAVGARLLVGSCIELRGGGLPYGPFAEALRRLAQDLEAEPMSDALAPAQRDLERLLHVSRQSPEGLLDTFDGRSEQVQLFALLLELLDHLGDPAPVVLVIEDLHWADQSTLDLLTFLVKSMRRERLLVVATYRTDELRRHHLLRPVLGELDRDMATSHIELKPFEREELDALVAALLGTAPSAEILDRVFRQSEGNAFFAEELVSAGISDVGVRLPRRLRDVVMTRVDTLSEEAKDTLRITAAAGGQVKHELLSAVSELPEPALLKALREVVVQSIIVVDPTSDTYSFRHALAREAVYSDLLPGERVQLHGRLARALAEDSNRTHSQGALTLAEIAHHWDAAHDVPQALAAAVNAGQAAMEIYAFHEAQRQLERALELWDQVPDAAERCGVDHVDLLEQAAQAARWAGDIEQALFLIRRSLASVEQARQPARAAVLLSLQASFLGDAGDGRASLAVADQAIKLLASEPPSIERARVLAEQGAALMAAARYRESRACCEEAIATSRLVGSRPEEGRGLTVLGIDLSMLGDPEGGIAHLLQARQIAEEDGNIRDLLRADAAMVTVLTTIGRFDEALQIALDRLGHVRHAGIEPAASVTLVCGAAEVLLRIGRWDEVEELVRDALSQRLPTSDALFLHLILGELEIGRGQFDQARADLELTRKMAELTTEPHILCTLHANVAELGIWRGDFKLAQSAVAAGLALMSEDDRYASWLYNLEMRAVADQAERARIHRSSVQLDSLRSLGEDLLLRAGRLRERLVAREGVFPEALVDTSGCEAEHARLEGRSNPDRWAAVADAWERLRRPYRVAYARWRHGEALLEAKAPRDAAAVLRAAYRLAAGLHAAALQREVEALARRSRIDLSLGSMDDRAAGRIALSQAEELGLTAREQEVLRYVVEGWTNRQIARTLFISEKTASVHVSNILGKLGVANRGQAAAAAHRLRLLPSTDT